MKQSSFARAWLEALRDTPRAFSEASARCWLLACMVVVSGCGVGTGLPMEEVDAGSASTRKPSGDPEWANWPMPELRGSGSPHKVSYDTSVVGVVRDEVTGLEWQREVEERVFTRVQAAKLYCAELELNGTGWRLPTVIELISLVNYQRIAPAIDPVAFPNTPAQRFVSSSAYRNSVNFCVWDVSFFGGDTDKACDGSADWRARCVR